MTVAHGIQHLYVGGLALSYPFVVAQFHLSYAVLGVVLTAAGLLGGFLQGTAGLLRQMSARAIIAAQNTGLAVASLLAAVAPAFGLFAAARVLGAAVSWPQHPVGSAYLSQRFPHRRATVLSWHTAGGSIGTVAAPLILSAVIATAGWRTGLLVLGALLLAGAVIVRVALPAERRAAAAGHGSTGGQDGAASQDMAAGDHSTASYDSAAGDHSTASHDSTPGHDSTASHHKTPGHDSTASHHKTPGHDSTPGHDESTLPAGPAPLRTVLRGRRVIALLIASTIAAGGRGLGVLTTYVPAYLHSGLHLPTLTVGALFTAVVAASVAGPVVGGMLADRFGRLRTLVTTYACGAVALVAFGFAGSNVALLAVFGVCVGVLAYTESPLLQAVFSDFTQHGSARSSFGAFFAISFGVGSLWTAALGWVITAAGFSVAFAVMAGSFVVAAAVIVAFVRE